MGKSKARTAPPAVEAEIKTEVAERRRRKAKEATPEVEVEAESPASPEPEAEEDELPDDGPDEDALAELLAEEDHEEHEEHEEGDEVEVKEEGGSAIPSKRKRGRPAKYKPPRDPALPKRPGNSYTSFVQLVYPEVKALFAKEEEDDRGGARKAVLAEVARRWKALSEEEKKPYEEAAAIHKAEYDLAMVAYVESGAKQRWLENPASQAGASRRKKAKQEPVPAAGGINPEMMGLLDKLAGSESLEGLHEVEEAIDEIPSTADRDQARRYLAQLLTLRQKLVIEGLARFLSQPGPEGAKAEPGTAAGIASTVVGTATTGRRTMKPEVAKRRRAQTAYKRALVKDYGFPKKYETAYLAFRSEHLKPIRDQHAMAHPGEPPSMKSVYEDVAYRWKSLTPEERAHWDAIGDENKREHQRKVQEWVEAHPDVPLKVPEQDVDAWEAVENEKRAKKGVQEEEEEEEGEE